MPAFLVLSLCLTAPKIDPQLVGTWALARTPFMTLNANGSGTLDEERVRWTADGSLLVLKDDENEEDRVPYSINGDTLTITMDGAQLKLTRAEKGEKKGKLGKKLEEAASAQVETQRPAQPQPQATAPTVGRAGSDQLSQLLMSSAWCWLRYASGNTYTQRVRFLANGTWSDSSESDIHVNNSLGYAQSTGTNQSGGQWAVKNGTLYLSNPPETPQLSPMPLTITRNSNGYPIINADGREYSQCN